MKGLDSTDKIEMFRLWQIHIALTREVVLAAKYSTANLEQALLSLMKNQEDLGANLGKFYGNSAGKKYTVLLKEHIDIAVKITIKIFTGEDPTQDINDWYRNAKDICKFLNSLNCHIHYSNIYDLFSVHLECTADEVNFVNRGRVADGLGDFLKCSQSVSDITLYIIRHC